MPNVQVAGTVLEAQKLMLDYGGKSAPATPAMRQLGLAEPVAKP